MQIVIDISKDRYDEIMSMDWKNCRLIFDEEIRAIHDGKALEQEPCGDCISRSAVLEAIDVKAWEFCNYLIRNGRNDEQKLVSHFADNLRECVGEDLPPVTPQPKMGRWIKQTLSVKPFGEDTVLCDQCAFMTDKDSQYNYCPNCGAKMQEVEE